MATTFNQSDTALFLANGDFWTALAGTGDPDTRLANLITSADDENPSQLFGTLPDNSHPCIGTSPRRPRKP